MVVAARDLGVVELLGLPAGSRLSVKENGNKLGEGGAVAWWSISFFSNILLYQNHQVNLVAWSARTYGIPVGRRLLVVAAEDVVERASSASSDSSSKTKVAATSPSSGPRCSNSGPWWW